MGRESNDLYKRLFGTTDEPLFGLTEKPTSSGLDNSIFEALSKVSSGELNNLSALAYLGKPSPTLLDAPQVNSFAELARAFSPVPSSIARPAPLGPRLRGLAALGSPTIAPPLPTTPPAPSKPDMDFIRKFVGGMAQKKAEVKDGRIMPSIDDLAIMEGRRVNAAFVYSDLHGFTKLVATQPENKSFVFLHTFVEVASRLTKYHNGQIVDCAGDRVLSVFHRSPGDHSYEPVHDAINYALYLQTAFDRVIGPAFASGGLGQLSLGVGIDYGQAIVGCVGIRNGKKIIFLGEPANRAAKLQDKATAGETIWSLDVEIRKPAYLTPANGWIFQPEVFDSSWIYRTTCVYKWDNLERVRV
jgi:class 3 adenylate cyclase